PLQDNGGPTPTHALLPGSPAIDADGSDCPPPATDQRGFPRPVDGNDDGVATCDIGAYELGGTAPGCPKTPTFPSIDCRLDELRAGTQAARPRASGRRRAEAVYPARLAGGRNRSRSADGAARGVEHRAPGSERPLARPRIGGARRVERSNGAVMPSPLWLSASVWSMHALRSAVET